MAYVEAVSNGTDPANGFRTRSNAFRSGAFNRARVIVTVNGTQRKAIKPSLRIRVPTGREPATADLDFKGFVPDRGQALVIGHGTSDNALFRGRIIRAERRVVRHLEPHPTYTVEATDYLFDLSRTYLPAGLTTRSVSAHSIVRGLLSAATPSTSSLGFTAEYVQSGMPFVAEFVVGPTESVVSALDRLAAAIGATWYSDVRQRLHFWTTSDPAPKPTISTLTGTGSNYFGLTRLAELPRVFSRVVGLGVETNVSYDAPSNYPSLPVDSVEGLWDVSSINTGYEFNLPSTGRLLVDTTPRSVTRVLANENLIAKPALIAAAPISSTANNYWVADLAEDFLGGASLDPFSGHRWVGLDGNYFHIASISNYSSSANTFYHHIFVRQTGPGSPPPSADQSVPAGTFFTAAPGEIVFDSADPGVTRTIPKGTPVRLFYEAASTTTANALASLCNNAAAGIASDTIDDRGLRSAQLIAAVTQRLSDGHPDRWVTYRLDTRDPLFDRGQTVHLSVTGPAESGGPAMTGSYTVQAIEIDGFEEMGDTKGPMRHVSLGPVTRPTLFNELARWNV